MKNIIVLIGLMSLTLGCKKENITAATSTKEDPEHIILHGSLGISNRSTILSASGNVVLVGQAKFGSSSRMLLYKTSPDGEVVFLSSFHEENSMARSVYEDAQQHLYVVGQTYGESALAGRAVAVAKLNSDGEVIWEKTYHPEINIKAYHIVGVNDDEIIICGKSESGFVFIKINSLGEELQFQIAENTNFGSPSNMLILRNGHILITTTTVNSAIRLSCYNTVFNLLWEKTYGSNRSGVSTIQLDNEDLVTVGASAYVKAGSNVIDSQKVIILKTAPNGELIWEKEVGDIDYQNVGTAIAKNEDGSFVIAGSGPNSLNGSTLYALSNTEHMLIHVDSAGNEIHSKYYADEKPSFARNIIKVDGERNVITGGHNDGIFFLNVNNEGF